MPIYRGDPTLYQEPTGELPIADRPWDHQFFEHQHLPPDLAVVVIHYKHVADYIVAFLPDNPSRDEALRELVKSKDAAVRSIVAKKRFQK